MADHFEVANTSPARCPLGGRAAAVVCRFNRKQEARLPQAAVLILILLTFRSNISERAVICKPALTQAAFLRLVFRVFHRLAVKLIRNGPGDIQNSALEGAEEKTDIARPHCAGLTRRRYCPSRPRAPVTAGSRPSAGFRSKCRPANGRRPCDRRAAAG